MVEHAISELDGFVEAYLNEAISDIDLSSFVTSNARERFSIHAAARLINAYDMYRSKKCYLDDVLGPLRNYLLSQQTSMALSRINIPKDNEFGIYLDKLTERYYVSFAFPDYVNDRFAKAAFLLEDDGRHRDIRGLDLCTNAFIQKLTGFKLFKSVAQKLAVIGALKTPNGYTTLISLPTGGGKSLITQSISYQTDGLTIVIVPTVSLALDQVRVCKSLLKTRNVDDEIFSYSGGDDIGPLLEAIKNKTAKIVFTSPEAAMLNANIRDALAKAANVRYLRNIVIDEAHIVVDWGALFRVEFQCLECWRKNLMKANPGIRTILLSATFDDHSVSVLKSLFATDDEKWIEIRCDALRHEPRFMNIKASSFTNKNVKLVELIRKMPHPLIAYVDSPDEAKRVASLLEASGIHNVRTFTGKTSSKDRRILIDEWTQDKFEIMVATNAFGVGVDKPDVRTVLHLTVPPDPNAYYQELGRGGRDRLPSLSIMCVTAADRKSARDRIARKVLTTDKIVGRWRSMLYSKSTKFMKEKIIIDTAVVPSYSDEDYFDDRPVSEGHKGWNIYVLLFLRRNKLIEIRDVIVQGDGLFFIVRITDDILRSGSKTEQVERLDPFRQDELNDYRIANNLITDALNNSEIECWSEMFFETYSNVSEYCAGCNEHDNIIDYSNDEFPLKKRIFLSNYQLDKEQISLFMGAREAVVFVNDDEIDNYLQQLERYRPSVLITSHDKNNGHFASLMQNVSSLIIIDSGFAKRLLAKNGHMYFCGVVIVKYDGNPREIYDLYRYFTRSLGKWKNVRILHVANGDCRFEWIDKRLSDLIDGPVLTLNS